MNINDLIKEIREKEGYSLQEMSEKVGFSKNFMHMVEKKDRNVSEKLLNKMVEKFPLYQKKLLLTYYNEKLPKNLIDKIASGEAKIVDHKEFQYDMYLFDTSSEGELNLENIMQVEFTFEINYGESIKNECIIVKIKGENMKPYFFEGDIIAFMKSEFKNWQSLDNKIVLVEIEGILYIKKLIFDSGEAYLHTFNERVYPPVKLSSIENIKYIARPKYRLSSSLDNLTL